MHDGIWKTDWNSVTLSPETDKMTDTARIGRILQDTDEIHNIVRAILAVVCFCAAALVRQSAFALPRSLPFPLTMFTHWNHKCATKLNNVIWNTLSRTPFLISSPFVSCVCGRALSHQCLIICLLLSMKRKTVSYTSAPMMPVSYSPAPVMQVHCVYVCGAGIFVCMYCTVCIHCICRYNAWSSGTV